MSEPVPIFVGSSVWPAHFVHLKEDQITDIVHQIIDEMSDWLPAMVERAMERALARQYPLVAVDPSSTHPDPTLD